MLKRSLQLTAVVVVAAGCSWPMAGQGPDRRSWSRFDTKITPANVATLTRRTFEAVTTAEQEIIGDKDAIFVRRPGEVRAFDPVTGAERWHGSYAGTSVPALRGDRLVVAADGSHCAVTSVLAKDNTLPVTSNVGGPDLTGTIGGGFSSCSMTSSVMVDGDRTAVSWSYFGFGFAPRCTQGFAVAWTGVSVLGPDLNGLWSVSEQTGGCGGAPVTPLPTRYGDVTRVLDQYVTTHGKDVIAYPITCVGTCAPSWITKLDDQSAGPAVALSTGSIAITSASGLLTVLDASTGAVQWTASGAGSGPIAATDAFVFDANASDQTLRAYAVRGCGSTSCGPAWTAPIGGATAFRPSIAGDVVFVGTGVATPAFDARGCGAASCNELASLAGPANGPVSVIGGAVFDPSGAGLLQWSLPAP